MNWPGRRRGCGCSSSSSSGPAAPYVQGAIGPEVAQQTKQRQQVTATMLGGAGPGPVSRTYSGDLGSPQSIEPTAMRLTRLVDSTQVDLSTGWPSLPGRLVVIPAWDGEPGAMAPTAMDLRTR